MGICSPHPRRIFNMHEAKSITSCDTRFNVYICVRVGHVLSQTYKFACFRRVSCSGEALKKALMGNNGQNIEHLQRRYPGVALKVNGTPSTTVPLERRLHVSVLCRDRSTLNSIMEDVRDLAETAVDLVADDLHTVRKQRLLESRKSI